MSEQDSPQKIVPVAEILPMSTRQALVDAAKIPDPKQRAIAIEAVQAMARARSPELFRKV